MSKNEINNLFSVNPSNLWDAEIVTIAKRIPTIGNLYRTGCMLCSVRKLRQTGYKTYQVHRFVWECYGVIPDGKVIDHIWMMLEMKTDYAIYNWCHSNKIARNNETFLNPGQ